MVAVGAAPVGVTNCLNFGNPEKPEVFWQLAEAVEGMREACLALAVPVVSGNVSLYNDTEGVSIAPTIVIGMVGHLEALERHCAAGFARDGDAVLLVGPVGMDLGGSEYQRWPMGSTPDPGPPSTSTWRRGCRRRCCEMIGAGLLASCHDLAEGGLGVALAESCILGGRGAALIDAPLRAGCAGGAGGPPLRGVAVSLPDQRRRGRRRRGARHRRAPSRSRFASWGRPAVTASWSPTSSTWSWRRWPGRHAQALVPGESAP